MSHKARRGTKREYGIDGRLDRQDLRGRSLVVLFLLHEARDKEPLYLSALAQRLGTAPATIVPVLGRFRRLGWVVDEWEGEVPGRPSRHLHYITADGIMRLNRIKLRELTAAKDLHLKKGGY